MAVCGHTGMTDIEILNNVQIEENYYNLIIWLNIKKCKLQI